MSCLNLSDAISVCKPWDEIAVIGVPYGSRTRVAAVKGKRPIVIQRHLAAWIALLRTSQTHGRAYWTLNGLAFFLFWNCSVVQASVFGGFNFPFIGNPA